MKRKFYFRLYNFFEALEKLFRALKEWAFYKTVDLFEK